MITNIFDIISRLFQENGLNIVEWSNDNIHNINSLPKITLTQVYIALGALSIFVILKKLGSLPISFGLINTFIFSFLGLDLESLHPCLEYSFSSTLLTIVYFYLLSNNNVSDLAGLTFLNFNLDPLSFSYDFLLNFTTYLQYICIFLNMDYNILFSLSIFGESLSIVNELIINYSGSILDQNPFATYFFVGSTGLGICYLLISLLGVTNPNFIISVYLFNQVYCWCINLNDIFG